MKQLKKQLLLTLSLTGDIRSRRYVPVALPYTTLYALMPDFSPSSVRGEVLKLREERLVSTLEHEGKVMIILTASGKEYVLRLFPALLGWQVKDEGVWTLCMFVGQQTQDQFFRKTRLFLLSIGFVQIAKGVYLAATPLVKRVEEEAENLKTRKYIVVAETRRILLGDERRLFAESLSLFEHVAHKKAIDQKLLAIEKQLHARTVSQPKLTLALRTFIAQAVEFYTLVIPVPEVYIPQELRLSSHLDRLFPATREGLLQISPQGNNVDN